MLSRVHILLGVFMVSLSVSYVCFALWSAVRRSQDIKLELRMSSEELILPMKVTSHGSPAPKRYLFVQQYLEHLGYASDSLISLLALSKALNRTVVAPFVMHARLNGFPSDGGADSARQLPFFFDGHHLNKTLDSAGVDRLASLEQMKQTCARGWDVVVHFRARSIDSELWGLAAADSFRALDSAAEQRLAEGGTAVVNCPGLTDYVQSFPPSLTGFERPLRVNATKCVDGKRMAMVERLEEAVFKGKPCVNILLWAAAERTGLPLKHHMRKPEFQSFVLRDSPVFVRQATSIRLKFLGMNYIGVHIGVLALYHQFGADGGAHLERGIALLEDQIKKLQQMNQASGKETRTYLVSDIDDSNLLEDNTTLSNMTELIEGAQKRLTSLRQSLVTTPVAFPERYSDHASKALINAKILFSADFLLTIGGGRYQEWIVQFYERQHFPLYNQLIFRFAQTTLTS